MKTLVAYFSAGGVTKNTAEIIAKELSAQTFEITPKIPYTREDLNWRDKASRSTIEMTDKSTRPEIVNAKVDLTDIDRVFIGFPMWWYIAPTIVNTFLEANDFAGKEIVLFATSGGSGFGKTVDFIKNSVSPTTVITEGRVFAGSTDEAEIIAFAAQYKQ